MVGRVEELEGQLARQGEMLMLGMTPLEKLIEGLSSAGVSFMVIDGVDGTTVRIYDDWVEVGK